MFSTFLLAFLLALFSSDVTCETFMSFEEESRRKISHIMGYAYDRGYGQALLDLGYEVPIDRAYKTDAIGDGIEVACLKDESRTLSEALKDAYLHVVRANGGVLPWEDGYRASR